MKSEPNKCQNCGKKIAADKWCCDKCFPLFDGDRFLRPDEVVITKMPKGWRPKR